DRRRGGSPQPRRAARPRRPQRRRASSSACERAGDLALEGLRVVTDAETAEHLCSDPAAAIDDEGRGEPGNAPVPKCAAATVVHDQVAETVLADERASVTRGVVRVHAENNQALGAILAPRALQQRRLVPAGEAPGRPEVQRDDTTPEAGE